MFEVNDLNDEAFNQPAILMCSSDNTTSCKIKLYGATIVSWLVAGEEKLFVSEKAILDGSKAIRGGIPLVFPQFGQPDSSMPQHGFARNKTWKLINSRTSADCCEVDLLLNDDESTTNLWPHKFNLIYTVKLSANELSTGLEIVNPSDTEFACQALLHTYLKISNIHDILCAGFAGFDFIDKMNNNAQSIETDNSIAIDREVDRIYCSKPNSDIVVSIKNHSSKEMFKIESYATSAKLMDGLNHSDNLSKVDGSEKRLSTDVVLWNAWIEKAKSLADMNDDGYLYYVCVEPGLVVVPQLVPPHSTLTLSQKIQAL